MDEGQDDVGVGWGGDLDLHLDDDDKLGRYLGGEPHSGDDNGLDCSHGASFRGSRSRLSF